MNSRVQGTTWITLSALFFGSYGVWSRLMSNSFGEFTQAWSRGVLILLIVLPLALWKKQLKPIALPDWKWFLAIGIGGGLNQAPYYFAFHHLEIGSATLLFYATLTLGGYILGYVFFQEKLSFIKLLGLFLALGGMSLLFHFSLHTTQILPAALGVLAGFMGSVEVVLSKKISQRYSTLQIMTAPFVVMVIVNFLASLALHEVLPPFTSTLSWLSQIGYTVAMLLACYCVFVGYQETEASLGGLIGLSEILFALGFGVLFFHEIITRAVLGGGVLIILAAALPNLASFARSHRK